jgi:hypothetical protein
MNLKYYQLISAAVVASTLLVGVLFGGINAAATKRSSSIKRLYVEHAFL